MRSRVPGRATAGSMRPTDRSGHSATVEGAAASSHAATKHPAKRPAARKRHRYVHAMAEGYWISMKSKKERTFLYVGVNDKYGITKSGKIGRVRVTERYQKCISFQAALGEAEALIGSSLSRGFKVDRG